MTNRLKLDIHWSFGFSKDKIGAAQSLCTKDRNALFLMCAHSGVVYDFENRKQTVLQGHCNIISCCAIDKTKRWIVTADSGADSIMVVWDVLTQLPVKTFLSPHANGVCAVDFSDDSSHVTTLSAKTEGFVEDQELAIWAWTTVEDQAIQRVAISTDDPMAFFHSVKFNVNDIYSLATTSMTSVYFWNWESFALESFNGRVSKADLGHVSGDYVSTIFLPNSETALTATTHGYVIVWENRSASTRIGAQKKAVKTAVKAVRLLECGINVITTSPNNYLVLGCSDGAVRFYDYYLRLEAWFEDLNAGPVMAVSFAIQPCPYAFNEGGQPGLKFWVPDFIVSTKDSFVVGVESRLFDEVRKEDRRGTLLMQGLSGPVAALACHPSQPLVAFLTKNGSLQLWNYEMKLLMNIRDFANVRAAGDVEVKNGPPSSASGTRIVPTARDIAFHGDGACMVISFSNGVVKIVATATLQDLQTFSPSLEGIGIVRFSPSGAFMAAADDSFHVMLFKREVSSPDAPPTYAAYRPFTYIGRALAHTAKIVGLEFGHKENTETLISVSEDRYCVEYNLALSNVESGVITMNTVALDGSSCHSFRIESFARPCCTLWHPRYEEDIEDRFIIANSEFKFKEFNADSKQCRKTCLAPRYGFPPAFLACIPYNDPLRLEDDPPIRAYAFATNNKVIGVGLLPLDGDPSKANAIVAHPDEVSGLTVSFDGNFIFSGGGSDLSVNMWAVLKEDILPEEISDGMAPFLSLLEGGPGGELHENLMDYFYYSQLRHGGEDTMEMRHLTGNVPLEEIPALVRAVGFYPSEEEVLNMINEVRYKQFVVTGEMQDLIGLDDFIKLYINHRPVVPLEKHYIQATIDTIADKLDLQSYGNKSVPWGTLINVLANHGEKIDRHDLDTYLGALTGLGASAIDPDEAMDARTFASQILGFETE
eukprot:gene7848-8660_t